VESRIESAGNDVGLLRELRGIREELHSLTHVGLILVELAIREGPSEIPAEIGTKLEGLRTSLSASASALAAAVDVNTPRT
jgi:hypothetical protein